MSELYRISCRQIDGEEVTLEQYQDNVLLIVNTASKCGFTSQYEGLESLYRKYKEQGLVIIGFPCDQFGHQEPGSDAEIKEFCSLNYGVSFPMFSKINVNGNDAHPIYKYLKQKAPGLMGTEGIKWNFTKFLVLPGGDKIKRYSSQTRPEQLEKDIEAALSKMNVSAAS